MFGRLMEYGGAVRRGLRPSPLPGDRFLHRAIVVNLTGKGQTSPGDAPVPLDTPNSVRASVRARRIA